MRTAGIDIGSRTVKLVILQDGQPDVIRIRENSFDALAICREIVAGERYDRIMATGYGRHLFSERIGGKTVTEIRAAALGVHHLCPDCRTALDIGGQDTKAIAIDGTGNAGRFEMNDKCAAGTGRFLEVTAMALGCTLAEFSSLAARTAADKAARKRIINSTCTVFAESEIVGLVAQGENRATIAHGIVDAVAARAVSLVGRVGLDGPLAFIGGLAHNTHLGDCLAERLGRPVHVPDSPQSVVALGCALAALGSPAAS